MDAILFLLDESEYLCAHFIQEEEDGKNVETSSRPVFGVHCARAALSTITALSRPVKDGACKVNTDHLHSWLAEPIAQTKPGSKVR
jgi:hypothetical protein